ncbi:MAG: sensor domain-containing protein [Rhodococcus fascians]
MADGAGRLVGHNGRVRSVGGFLRGCAAATAVLAVVASAGCAGTVTGSAVRDDNAAPTDVPPLTESQLDGVLLDIAQLNAIVGATRLEVVIASDEMSTNSDVVSDPDCLGSIFGAEELVYRSSGWIAMRDQVAHEPGPDNAHWVEQSVVLYPSNAQARDFVGGSTSTWRDCSGFSVAVNDGSNSSIWLIGDVSVDDDMVTQVVVQEDSDGWECQHALTSVSNLSIETLACAFGIHDEAVTIAQNLVASAANQ